MQGSIVAVGLHGRSIQGVRAIGVARRLALRDTGVSLAIAVTLRRGTMRIRAARRDRDWGHGGVATGEDGASG